MFSKVFRRVGLESSPGRFWPPGLMFDTPVTSGNSNSTIMSNVTNDNLDLRELKKNLLIGSCIGCF